MENDYLDTVEPNETLWLIEVNGPEFISVEELERSDL